MVVANEDSPVFLGGAFETIAACYDHDVLVDGFRTGAGVGWQDHDDRRSRTRLVLRSRLRRPSGRRVATALDGVVEKLRAGSERRRRGVWARCVHGHTRAEAFQRSTFVGLDIHEPSIVAVRTAAEEAGVDRRVRFDVATAQGASRSSYDLVCLFDCLHDMGDPVGAARRIRQALAPDGTLLLVEPLAGDASEHNLNPVGRTFYGLSTVICTSASLAQEVGLGLGAQAGELHLGIVLQGGRIHPRAAGNRDPVQRHPGGTAVTAIGVAPIVASTD